MQDGTSGTAIFETALGWVGLAWSGAGITQLQLPHSDRDRTADSLARRANGLGEGAPPPAVRSAIDAIIAYAAGERVDFSGVPVDLTGIDGFRLDIYRAAQSLAYGETTTYGGLAERSGHPGMARETGQALGANPVPIIVPCHRILAAGGRFGGFSAPGGTSTKRRLLDLECARPPSPAGQSAFAF